MKIFDEKFYICEACHKHLYKNEIPCQAVCNKIDLDLIPDELTNLKKLEKILISKRLLFKKIATMHGKGEFSKLKGSIWNIPVEAANISNVLPRPTVSNRLIVVRLKPDPKYRGHIYFEPVRPQIIYQELTYLKFLLQKVSEVRTCLDFLILLRFKEKLRVLQKKNISDGKEMTENINYNKSETKFAAVEDPLNM